MSAGGLFIWAAQAKAAVSVTASVDFLVQEGQIRADAVVRHIEPGAGLGLKFTAVGDLDRWRLKALLTRLRDLSLSHGKF
jgi:hypothetical protein